MGYVVRADVCSAHHQNNLLSGRARWWIKVAHGLGSKSCSGHVKRPLAHRPLHRIDISTLKECLPSTVCEVCKHQARHQAAKIKEEIIGSKEEGKKFSSELKIKSRLPLATGSASLFNLRVPISGQTGVIICLRTPRHPARAGVDCESTDAPATPVTIVTAVQPLDSREYERVLSE